MEACRLTASEAARLIEKGELSVEDLTRSCLARIGERDPAVKAWTYLDPDAAVRRARELDKIRVARGPLGPLHGLPFGIKDMIDTADMPTTNNSPAYFDNRPSHDADCVRVIRATGGLVLGKTDTVEFAAGGRKALTHHPMKPGTTPGGSSSGSGAAVGDFQVPLALGTQTGGSLIRPASFNGVYALKPTLGVVSWSGARQYSPSLDTLGWYGRSPKDLALVARAFRLPGIDDAEPESIGALKIGVVRSHNWSHAAPEGVEALELAGRRLGGAGATVFDLDLPEEFSALNDAQWAIMMMEGRAHFLAEYLSGHALLHQDFRDKVENREGITPDTYLGFVNLAARCRALFDGLFGGQLDAIVTLAAPGEAPPGLDTTGNWVMNAMWTLLHAPCVAIPCHSGPNGLPVGVQIVGPRLSDARMLAIAEAIAPALDEKLAA